MKPLEEIITPFKSRLNGLDYKNSEKTFNPTIYLFQQWAYRVPKNWYGIDLGGAPFIWAQIIDKFLEEVEKECANFEIHQIKIKFGGLRCYLGNINTSVQKEIDKLEDLLYNDSLAY